MIYYHFPIIFDTTSVIFNAKLIVSKCHRHVMLIVLLDVCITIIVFNAKPNFFKIQNSSFEMK